VTITKPKNVIYAKAGVNKGRMPMISRIILLAKTTYLRST